MVVYYGGILWWYIMVVYYGSILWWYIMVVFIELKNNLKMFRYI